MSYMTIDCVTESGEVREALVSSASPPRIGEWFKDDDGARVRRIHSQIFVTVKRSISEQRAWCIPRKHQLLPGQTAAPSYDNKGVAVFDSQREINEYVSKHNDNPRNDRQLAWNPEGNE